jgi:hypothetical protein
MPATDLAVSSVRIQRSIVPAASVIMVRVSQRSARFEATIRGMIKMARPGKYEGNGKLADAVEALHQLSMNGCDDEAGDVNTTGFYCLLNAPFDFIQEDIDVDKRDVKAIRRRTGKDGCIILEEDSNGFVTADWYKTKLSCTKAWDDIIEHTGKLEELEE